MSKRMKKALLCLLVFALLAAAMSSPDIALRISVFFATPKSAFTMHYSELRSGAHDTLYRIDENWPVDAATGNPLCDWIVYHWGPFYIATWNGEG